ncbi:type II toxin-antitoxin system Phd/YefM family antitoxin [Sphingomonas sp.]|uniref:type II toxin-antitoxin system Phd/YefM family antitoxin n=1 Tax=Sphingomonas sp. TaxID=28214 RepID=UPI0035C7CD73
MELSVREDRAHFAFALEAAERGERGTITKNGKPVAELGQVSERHVNPLTRERLEEVRREFGFGKPLYDSRSNEEWLADFNDPEVTRLMLGEDENSDER